MKPYRAEHSCDIPSTYLPYLSKLLAEHETVVCGGYMGDDSFGDLPRERIYIDIGGPIGLGVLQAIDGRQIWQVIGDYYAERGFGLSVLQQYQRRARHRWPWARISTYQQHKCTGNGGCDE